MAFSIRTLPPTVKLREVQVLEVLASIIPQDAICAASRQASRPSRRCRKLPAELSLLLVVAMNLFTHQALHRVLAKLLQGLRFIWPDPTFRSASKGAICRARYRLGPRPLVALFHRVCQPLATANTPGAFLFGLRLMALDGTVEVLPDSASNAHYFGRARNQYGEGSFPQVRGLYLIECGTHAVVDAGFWPYRTSEQRMAQRLLRSIEAGMLVLWDCGLHSARLVEQVCERGAQVLGRVPASVRLPIEERLADGTYLSTLTTGKDWLRRRQGHARARVLEYTLDDDNRPGAGERHRLLTTLLDPEQAPALALIEAYHERWEAEVVLDEQDTHQRLSQQPLRSQRPVGVIQELYGLLLAHYVLRALMVEAATGQELDPRRLSFVHTVTLVCDAIAEFQMVHPSQRKALYERLLADIGSQRLPPRGNRLNPRVLKRKRRRYRPKLPCHQHWPQPAKPFLDAIVILK